MKNYYYYFKNAFFPLKIFQFCFINLKKVLYFKIFLIYFKFKKNYLFVILEANLMKNYFYCFKNAFFPLKIFQFCFINLKKVLYFKIFLIYFKFKKNYLFVILEANLMKNYFYCFKNAFFPLKIFQFCFINLKKVLYFKIFILYFKFKKNYLFFVFKTNLMKNYYYCLKNQIIMLLLVFSILLIKY